MQNRKYQVFISSTYSDLVEERKKVLDAVLKVTGVRGAYNDVKEVFKRRNKEKNAEETPEKPDKIRAI